MPRIQVSVVVLGDVGRSPRMQYHALALASSLAEVDVVGYAGSALSPSLRDHDHIRWHLLRPPAADARREASRARFVGSAAMRALRDGARLLWLLLRGVRKPDVILVQNPPAIPSLLVAWLAARLRSAKLVIDWHNLGYTMLALRLGGRHPLVRLAHRYERLVGRRADAHLCVSRRMQAALRDEWSIAGAVVLHDRPAARFAPTRPEIRQDVLRRLQEAIGFPVGERRAALLVSPTSWTADEDFSVLLDAARRCEELIQAHEASAGARRFPPLVVLITGTGPLRAHYEARIAALPLHRVVLRTLWLAPEDYPLVLGVADVGLCLHRSSSGLDLPMKLADMFGSGLPVCALDYGPCLAEQVRDGVDGLLFTTGAQLAGHLYALFRGFPDESPLLDQLRRNVGARALPRWADEWNAVALPVFAA